MLSLLITVVTMSAISCIGGWYLGARSQRRAEDQWDEEIRRNHRHEAKSEYQRTTALTAPNAPAVDRANPDQFQKIDEIVAANNHFVGLILSEFKKLHAALKTSFAEMEEARGLRSRILESAIHAHGQLDSVLRVQPSSGEVLAPLIRFKAILDRIAQQSVRVRSIAAEVNVLAVNAGLEAARLGEPGRGFTIFADCISKLSGNSTEAVMQIYEMIEQIREDMQPLLTESDPGPEASLADRKSILSGFSQLEVELTKLDQISARSVSYLANGTQSAQDIETKLRALADTLASGLNGILNEANLNSVQSAGAQRSSGS